MKKQLKPLVAIAALSVLGLTTVVAVSASAAPQGSSVSATGCNAPMHLCPTCDGTGTYCALHCYECPAP